ncbi:MAG: M48 family metallopeptidase [Akkermansiaceae bacterium]
MDFFEAQEEARKKTKWLVLWFILAVVGVIVSVDLLILALAGGGDPLPLVLLASVVTGGIILGSSGFKSMQLNAGGSVVAEDLGGRLVMPGSTDFEEKRLLNIVSEMALASGMPVPQVYLMDHEEGINAFAAGTEPSNAVIGVTRGCLQRLSREELSAVIAHEFSHILNGDMRLNMRLMGLVFGLVVLSIIGRAMVELLRFQSFSSRRNNKEGGNVMLVLFLLGLGLLVIGSLGSFFGRLIQSAVSRQREFLADASSVQFTRNPDGIVGALKKIGGSEMGSKMKAPKAVEASHMFFSNGGMFSYGLATHPPLDARIRAVQASWDGEFEASEIKPVAADRVSEKEERKGPLDALPGAVVMGAVSGIGQGERRQISTGHDLHQGLSHRWREAVQDREVSQAVIFGLLLAEDDQLLRGEISFLEKTAGVEAKDLALQWQAEVRGLHSARKIALVELALPTLRGLSQQEYERFRDISRWLITNDEQVDLFEFMIQRVIERHLGNHFDRQAFRKIRYHNFDRLLPEANLLVSTVSEIGAESAEDAAAAYLSATSGWRSQFERKGVSSHEELDEVLDRFEVASPLVKKQVLEVCVTAAARDGRLSSREAELLRTIADSIGCPLPPFSGEVVEDEI